MYVLWIDEGDMVMDYGWPPLVEVQGGSEWTEIWGPVLISLVLLSYLGYLS